MILEENIVNNNKSELQVAFKTPLLGIYLQKMVLGRKHDHENHSKNIKVVPQLRAIIVKRPERLVLEKA